MGGYAGYSMSNNAVAAYEGGERPLSKWTKKAILARIVELIAESEENGDIVEIDFDFIKALPLKSLKEFILYESSWHHTSKMYNRTGFYDVSLDDAINIKKVMIRKIVRKAELESQESWYSCPNRTNHDWQIRILRTINIY